MSNRDLEIIERRVCYQGFYRLESLRLSHRLFGGGMSPPIVREVIEKSDVAAVLLYDPARDEVVMIEQFRVGARSDPRGPWLIEVVAGLIETGETPEDVARREAIEEAGCTVSELLPISTFYTSPAKTSQRIHLFLGRTDSAGAGGIHGLAEEGEDIRVLCLPAEEALALVEQGRADSAWPLIALLWFAGHRERTRQLWLGTAASPAG
ncbi:NUDIX domain-containing protein [Accumulibacter sp.]|uniref:NUDIX domain-containing protein n=1 Tax=Accumulibacter sp. TaxID=2053492 RepID=UPI0025EC01CA|nr:NUDIX domain-containing protein [Accumulibacter sp.]MCM8594467.1 NUDIX domain-containing protein [Accumulibacter sp.]MCM8626732.1 NUDIX domain-containing protein [Accumulibacter sp.]MDS4048613.1 NUDIX domain-containing protein [Accumulibacter sp.]